MAGFNISMHQKLLDTCVTKFICTERNNDSIIGAVIIITGSIPQQHVPDTINPEYSSYAKKKSAERRAFQSKKMQAYFANRDVYYIQHTDAENINERFKEGAFAMNPYAKDSLSHTKHTACYHSHLLASLQAEKYMSANPGKYALILEDDTYFDVNKHAQNLEQYFKEAIAHEYDIIKISQSMVPFEIGELKIVEAPKQITSTVFDAPNFMGTFAYVLRDPIKVAKYLLTCAEGAYNNYKKQRSLVQSKARDIDVTYYPVDQQFAFSACSSQLIKLNALPSYMDNSTTQLKICTYVEQICQTHSFSTMLMKDVKDMYVKSLALGHKFL